LNTSSRKLKLWHWFDPCIDAALFRLDCVRAKILRQSLALNALRCLWRNRSLRVGLSFGISTVVNLAIALAFPLWLLALGPAVFGIPHLIATARFAPRILDPKIIARFRSFVALISILSLSVAILRLATLNHYDFLQWMNLSNQFSEWQSNNSMELVASAVLLAALTIWRANLLSSITSWGLLLLLFMASAKYPKQSIGLLILGHNFVSFYYWIALSQSQTMRKCAAICLVVFGSIHWMIFSGLFDPTMSLFATIFPESSQILSFAGLSRWDVGSAVFPNTSSDMWLSRAVAAYAFGQAVHYFVWLRAIPESQNTGEVPISWRHTWRNFQSEFGLGNSRFIVLILVGSIVLWIGLQFPTARIVYFCLAAMHGYIEIVAAFAHSASVGKPSAQRILLAALGQRSGNNELVRRTSKNYRVLPTYQQIN
jgi:hypothetical protein